jgi:hypothetical protein
MNEQSPPVIYRCRSMIEVAARDFPMSFIVRCSKHLDHSGMHLWCEPFDWTWRKIAGGFLRLQGKGWIGWDGNDLWIRDGLTLQDETQQKWPAELIAWAKQEPNL